MQRRYDTENGLAKYKSVENISSNFSTDQGKRQNNDFLRHKLRPMQNDGRRFLDDTDLQREQLRRNTDQSVQEQHLDNTPPDIQNTSRIKTIIQDRARAILNNVGGPVLKDVFRLLESDGAKPLEHTIENSWALDTGTDSETGTTAGRSAATNDRLADRMGEAYDSTIQRVFPSAYERTLASNPGYHNLAHAQALLESHQLAYQRFELQALQAAATHELGIALFAQEGTVQEIARQWKELKEKEKELDAYIEKHYPKSEDNTKQEESINQPETVSTHDMQREQEQRELGEWRQRQQIRRDNPIQGLITGIDDIVVPFPEEGTIFQPTNIFDDNDQGW